MTNKNSVKHTDNLDPQADQKSRLCLEGVGKRFGGLAAVEDVNMELRSGEILGLIGPNGAGKTTIINLISGVFQPSDGTIRLGDRLISDLATYERRRLGIARTFQVVKPFRGMTVRENIAVPACFGSGDAVSIPEAFDRADEMLEFVGLDAASEMLAAQLNLADRKRLELARALASRPRVLLLDEVMGGLGPEGTQRIMKLIHRINATGVSILLIEHVMRVVMEVSQRIVVLHHGRQIAEGSPQEVANDPQVVEAYLGKRFEASHRRSDGTA